MGIRTELSLRLPNSPGAAASVCRQLADERVNIIAMTLDAGGHLHLLVDNPLRAAGVLRDQHHQVLERDVIVSPLGLGPGALATVLRMAAEAGINLEYAYTTTSEGGVSSAVVLGVEDVRRAAAVAGL